LPSGCADPSSSPVRSPVAWSNLAQRIVDQSFVRAQFSRVLDLRLAFSKRRQRILVVALAALNLGDAKLRIGVGGVRRTSAWNSVSAASNWSSASSALARACCAFRVVRIQFQRAAIGRGRPPGLLHLIVAGSQVVLDARRSISGGTASSVSTRAAGCRSRCNRPRHISTNILGVGVELLRVLELGSALALSGQRVELAQQQLGLPIAWLQPAIVSYSADRELQQLARTDRPA